MSSQIVPPQTHLAKHKSTSGFTLIELSIVLVIIGLIAGGILVGQDLVEGGKIRQQISQIEKYTTAAHTFRLKYNCLPGDCSQAQALGLGTSAEPGANGNGDGAIVTQNSSAYRYSHTHSRESYNFWYHLQQADLLDQQATGYVTSMADSDLLTATPVSPFSHIHLMVSNMGTAVDLGGNPMRRAGNSFFIFDKTLIATHDFHRSGFTPKIAHDIDSKIDDGLPYTGQVACTGGNAVYIAIPLTTAAHCGAKFSLPGNNGCNYNNTNSYNLSAPNDCQIAFLDKF